MYHSVTMVMGKAVHVQGIYEKSMHLPLNFPVNQKLLLKKQILKKKIYSVFMIDALSDWRSSHTHNLYC